MQTTPSAPAAAARLNASSNAPGAGADLVFEAVATPEAWQWTATDTLVHALPLYHVHGLVLGLLGPLRLGGRLHHVGRFSPEAVAAAGGSIIFGVPTMWSRIGDSRIMSLCSGPQG